MIEELFGAAQSAMNTGKGLGLFDPVVRMAAHLTNTICPNIPPDPTAMAQAFRADLLDFPTLSQLSGFQGVSVPVWNGSAFVTQPPGVTLAGMSRGWAAVWEMGQQMPQPEDLMQMHRLKLIDDETFTSWMKRQGIWHESNRLKRLALFNSVIPTPDALVSFALREAWDAATVARFQYDDEFPPEFKVWMAAQGADSAAPPGGPGTNAVGAPTWSQLYWRTHWTSISPNLAYEMFQRLRPGRFERFARDLPGLRAFTFADLGQVLKVNDYPVPFRPQLAAIAYRRPRLVDIDRFFQAGAIDVAEVLEMHKDLGYSPADAQIRTDWLTTKNLGAKLPPARRNPVPAIMQAYRIGTLNSTEASNMLMRVLSDNAFVNVDIQPDNPALLQRFRQYRTAITQLILTEDLRIDSQETREILSATRRQFMHGIINETDATTQLTASNITAGRVRGYLRSWKRILQSGRLLLSTAHIRSLVVDGILPLATAVKYLQNLGWKEPEITYLTAEMARDLEVENEKIAERQARTERQRVAAQERQAGLLDRQRRRIIRQLNNQSTPTQLHKYAVRGILTMDEYAQELDRRGYDLAEIDRRRRLAEQERVQYLQRQRRRRGAAGAAGGAAAAGS